MRSLSSVAYEAVGLTQPQQHRTSHLSNYQTNRQIDAFLGSVDQSEPHPVLQESPLITQRVQEENQDASSKHAAAAPG